MLTRIYAATRTARRLALAAGISVATAAGLMAEDAAPAVTAPAKTDTAAKPAPKAAPVQLTAADHIVNQTNAYRAQSGLPPMQVDPRLTAAAQQYANHLARTGTFGHYGDGRDPGARIAAQGYSWGVYAENMAMSGFWAGSPEQMAMNLMSQWLNSPGHRVNIYHGQCTQIGCATAQSPNGTVYGVQVFASPGGSGMQGISGGYMPAGRGRRR